MTSDLTLPAIQKTIEADNAWQRAHAEAAAAGKGVVLVDGRLIETLHVENARRLVALAEEIDRLPIAG